MHRLSFAVLLLVVASFSADTSLAAPACQVFRFEALHSVSVRELGQLSLPQTAAGPAGSIVYTPFDTEDHPIRGGQHAAGLLMITNSDLGATPIAGIVWTNKSTETENPIDLVFERHAKDQDNITAAAVQAGIITKPCPLASLAIILHRDGKIDIDGKFVGSILRP